MITPCLSRRMAALWLCLALLPLLTAADGQPALKRQVWMNLNSRSSIQYIRYDSEPAGLHRIHAVIVDLRDDKLEVRPALAAERATPEELARRYGASVAVNGGFFSTSDGDTVSYVTIDGRTAADPLLNLQLVSNMELRPYLRSVIGRSELRILVDSRGRRSFSITSHTAPAPPGYRVLHALQGGPMLLPWLRLREEAFIRPATSRGQARVAARALDRAPRTAVGLISSQRAVILMVERGPGPRDPSGMSLPQLAEFMRHLGCTSALALDGGSSSSMYFNTDPRLPAVTIPGITGRRAAPIKSALIVIDHGALVGSQLAGGN